MGEDGQMADSYSSDLAANPNEYEGVDWRLRLKEYHEFLQWDDEELPDYDNMAQDEAKNRLRDDLEFIIGTNGYNELYETEREYMKMLGMEEE